MYSPGLGRFMQPDPIGFAAGMNWYAYVGNDPVNAVDPKGLDEEEEYPIVVTAPPCNEGWARINGSCSPLESLFNVVMGLQFDLADLAGSFGGVIVVTATPKPKQGPPNCSAIDHAITANNYLGLAADGTTVIAGGGAFLAAGSGAEPVAAFLGVVAVNASQVSRLSALSNVGLYAANGDFIGAAESALGSLVGHGFGKVAGLAFRNFNNADDVAGFSWQALTGEYGICVE